MLGIPGTGFYGRIRTISNSLRADRQHLANAPLNRRQRQILQQSIKLQEEELKKIRGELKASKLKK